MMITTPLDLEFAAEELANAVQLYYEIRADIPLVNSKREADAVDMALLSRTDVREPLEYLVMAVGYDDWDLEDPFAVSVWRSWMQAMVSLNEGSAFGEPDQEDNLDDAECSYPDDEYEESPFDLIDVERGQELVWEFLRVPEYAVYHVTSPLAMLRPDPNDWQSDRGQHYRHVANVQAELSRVFFLTNHDGDQDWTQREEISWVVSGVSPRSTSVGDVVYQLSTKRAWLVGYSGLQEISRTRRGFFSSCMTAYV